MKVKVDLYYSLLGFVLYSFYLIGALFSSIEGISIVYAFVFFILLINNFKAFTISKQTLSFIFYINIVVCLAFIYSEHSFYSQYKLFFFLYKFNTLFFIPFFIPSNKIILFFNGVLISLTCVLIVLYFYSISNFSSFDANNRLEVGILNPIWISRIALEFLLLIIILCKPGLKAILFLSLFIIIILYASGSKGAIVAFFISLFLYSFRDLKFSTKLFVTGIIVLSFTILIGTLSNYVDNDYIRDRFLILIPEGDEQKLLEDNRAVFIPYLLQNYFNSNYSTVLFGSGLGNSGYFMFGNNFNFRYYPHNSLIEILLELGLINFVIIIYLTIKSIVLNNNIYVYLLIYCIINSMFSGDFILNEFVFLYSGFMIANSNK